MNRDRTGHNQLMTDSTQTTPLPKLSMSSPEEILAAVPYLVGFHVRESVVALVLAGSHVVLTARLDAVLAEPGQPRLDGQADGRVDEASFATAVAQRLRVAIAANGGDGLVLVGYHERVEPMAEFLASLALAGVQELTAGGQGLIDVLLVTTERWYELLSLDPDASRGHRLDHDAVPTAAQAVYLGLNALPNRAGLERHVEVPAADEAVRLRPVFGTQREAVAALDDDGRATRAAELVDAALDSELSEAQLVQLAVLATQIDVRDALLLETDAAVAAVRVDLWTSVVRHSIEGYQLGPLCVLAFSAWLSGNGALQVICLQRMRRIDPGYRMLALLEQMNEAALPPSTWDHVGGRNR